MIQNAQDTGLQTTEKDTYDEFFRKNLDQYVQLVHQLGVLADDAGDVVDDAILAFLVKHGLPPEGSLSEETKGQIKFALEDCIIAATEMYLQETHKRPSHDEPNSSQRTHMGVSASPYFVIRGEEGVESARELVLEFYKDGIRRGLSDLGITPDQYSPGSDMEYALAAYVAAGTMELTSEDLLAQPLFYRAVDQVTKEAMGRQKTRYVDSERPLPEGGAHPSSLRGHQDWQRENYRRLRARVKGVRLTRSQITDLLTDPETRDLVGTHLLSKLWQLPTTHRYHHH